jgi:plastocyanin domain-containing protein
MRGAEGRVVTTGRAVGILAAVVVAGACRGGPREVSVLAGVNGFDPWRVEAHEGEALVLVVTRTTDDTCATEIEIPDAGVRAPLPLLKPVRVELTPKHKGTLRFSCAMKMFQGEIDVR